MDLLNAMQVFVTVVDAGSFSAAAGRLGTGQPAVSKIIAQLEERLGVRLLLRSTRGLTATEAGLGFYAGARRALDESEAAQRAARGAGTGLSGSLRVCAPVTFGRLHIVPQLQRFLSAHPQLELDLVLDDRYTDLLEMGIDVALRLGELGDSSMTARRIGHSPRVVLGTPAYFAAAGTPVAPAQLAQHQAIMAGQGGGGGAWMFRRGSEEVPVVLSGRVTCNAAEGVRAAVLAGLGLTVASEWMFAPELADGRVQRVLDAWTLPHRDLWAVFPGGRLASAKARAFVEFVEGIVAETAPLDAATAGSEM